MSTGVLSGPPTIGRQVLVRGFGAGRVGVAVGADDGIDAGHLRRQVGVDVVVDLDALGIGGEADVGQGDDHVVGRPKIGGVLLACGDRVGEGQARDVAGQLVVGHAVVGDAQDGDLDAIQESFRRYGLTP